MDVGRKHEAPGSETEAHTTPGTAGNMSFIVVLVSLPSCPSVPLGVTWNWALADVAFTLFDHIQGTLSLVTPNLILGLQAILPNLCPGGGGGSGALSLKPWA